MGIACSSLGLEQVNYLEWGLQFHAHVKWRDCYGIRLSFAYNNEPGVRWGHVAMRTRFYGNQRIYLHRRSSCGRTANEGGEGRPWQPGASTTGNRPYIRRQEKLEPATYLELRQRYRGCTLTCGIISELWRRSHSCFFPEHIRASFCASSGMAGIESCCHERMQQQQRLQDHRAQDSPAFHIHTH